MAALPDPPGRPSLTQSNSTSSSLTQLNPPHASREGDGGSALEETSKLSMATSSPEHDPLRIIVRFQVPNLPCLLSLDALDGPPELCDPAPTLLVYVLHGSSDVLLQKLPTARSEDPLTEEPEDSSHQGLLPDVDRWRVIGEFRGGSLSQPPLGLAAVVGLPVPGLAKHSRSAQVTENHRPEDVAPLCIGMGRVRGVPAPRALSSLPHRQRGIERLSAE